MGKLHEINNLIERLNDDIQTGLHELRNYSNYFRTLTRI